RYFSQLTSAHGRSLYVTNAPTSYSNLPNESKLAFNRIGMFTLEHRNDGRFEIRNLPVVNDKILNHRVIEIDSVKSLNLTHGEVVATTALIESPNSSKFYALVSVMGDFIFYGANQSEGLALRHVLLEIDPVNATSRAVWSKAQPDATLSTRTYTEYDWSALRIKRGMKETYRPPAKQEHTTYDLSTQARVVYPLVSKDGKKLMILARDNKNENAPAMVLGEVDLK